MKGHPAYVEGMSPAMRKVWKQVESFAPLKAPVLIEGPTGSGKEVVARAIHARSRRAARPFQAINCGALTDGLLVSEAFGHRKGSFTGAYAAQRGIFHEVSGGTIFLDEIGEASEPFQVLLLRTLDTGEIRPVGGQSLYTDVRVIAATNRDLEKEVAGGRFRSDLFYRLQVLRICLPSLDQRPEDIPELLEHHLARICREENLELKRLSAEALTELTNRSYPGNVRELQSVLLRAVARSGDSETITAAHLSELDSEGDPSSTNGRPSLKKRQRRWLRGQIRDALDRADGNLAAAARELGVTTRWLQILIRRLLDPPNDDD
jgi:transcriptional regulator with GAF, ATPase, and Fis domain